MCENAVVRQKSQSVTQKLQRVRERMTFLYLILHSCRRGDAPINALNTRIALIFNIMIDFIEKSYL